MTPIPSENGVDGDDEREEDDEKEEEPRLKYQRMGGSIPNLLSSDAASCIAVAERMISLGTLDGTIHILDFLGNQVRPHSLAFSPYLSRQLFINLSNFCI